MKQIISQKAVSVTMTPMRKEMKGIITYCSIYLNNTRWDTRTHTWPFKRAGWLWNIQKKMSDFSDKSCFINNFEDWQSRALIINK